MIFRLIHLQMSCLIQEVWPGEALSAAAKVLLLLRRPHSVRVLIGGRHEAHPEILLRAGRQLWESGRGTGGSCTTIGLPGKSILKDYFQ